MIRRVLSLLSGQRCNAVGQRVDHAIDAFKASDAHLKSLALDIINRSMPDVRPYTPDQLSEAIAEVTRRSTANMGSRGQDDENPDIATATEAVNIARGAAS